MTDDTINKTIKDLESILKLSFPLCKDHPNAAEINKISHALKKFLLTRKSSSSSCPQEDTCPQPHDT